MEPSLINWKGAGPGLTGLSGGAVQGSPPGRGREASRLSGAGPSQLSRQTGAARAEPDTGNRFNQLPSAPSAVWGACEGECV